MIAPGRDRARSRCRFKPVEETFYCGMPATLAIRTTIDTGSVEIDLEGAGMPRGQRSGNIDNQGATHMSGKNCSPPLPALHAPENDARSGPSRDDPGSGHVAVQLKIR
jgi:hypothetical protein